MRTQEYNPQLDTAWRAAVPVSGILATTATALAFYLPWYVAIPLGFTAFLPAAILLLIGRAPTDGTPEHDQRS